jgi:hypothetical protein
VDVRDGAAFQSRARVQVMHDKDEETTRFLVQAIGDTTVFELLDELTLSDLAGQMFPVKCHAGEDVIVQGDEGDKLYIVGTGEYNVCRHASRARPKGREPALGMGAGALTPLPLARVPSRPAARRRHICATQTTRSRRTTRKARSSASSRCSTTRRAQRRSDARSRGRCGRSTATPSEGR